MTRHYPSEQDIWELAREHGLDPYPVHFELVPAPVLYEFAAYLIPGRMSHWSYGKAYHLMKTRYDYGLNKLYEMVINSNPAYAFLLDSNSELENTFVRAHVMGHVDFFRHNRCFSHTVPDMMDVVSQHADRVRQYEFQYGRPQVESFLDAVLALQEHVSPPAPVVVLPKRQGPGALSTPPRGWDDVWQRTVEEETHVHAVKPQSDVQDDVLEFLIENARDLEDWQKDVIGMVRDEMIYFWPQIRTKIMNEGWASYWHVKLMHDMDISDQDFLDFARLHASVTAPMTYQINPYSLGYHIYRSIAEGEGQDAIFLARSVDDDVSFVRNYLTEELVERLNLYVFGPDQDQMVVKSRKWTVVRDRLVQELIHGGIPVIHVDDGDFNRRGELYLIHRHEGVDLDIPYAEKTLQHVQRLWRRPVHLETISDKRRLVLTYDGKVNTKVVL